MLRCYRSKDVMLGCCCCCCWKKKKKKKMKLLVFFLPFFVVDDDGDAIPFWWLFVCVFSAFRLFFFFNSYSTTSTDYILRTANYLTGNNSANPQEKTRRELPIITHRSTKMRRMPQNKKARNQRTNQKDKENLKT